MQCKTGCQLLAINDLPDVNRRSIDRRGSCVFGGGITKIFRVL